MAWHVLPHFNSRTSGYASVRVNPNHGTFAFNAEASGKLECGPIDIVVDDLKNPRLIGFRANPEGKYKIARAGRPNNPNAKTTFIVSSKGFVKMLAFEQAVSFSLEWDSENVPYLDLQKPIRRPGRA